MPSDISHRESLRAASDRLGGLRRQLFELALLIAFVSTILLRPVHSGKVNFHPSMAPTWYSTSLITGILSCTVSLMMKFYCDDAMGPNRLERMLTWAPLILLDLSIVELIAGISASGTLLKHPTIFNWYSRGLVLGCICLAVLLAYKWSCKANAVPSRVLN